MSIIIWTAVGSIRGIVEIEQAERVGVARLRHRSLEHTIQILGIGFSGGAIISGVIVQHIDKIKISLISPKNPPHAFYTSLLLSVLARLFFISIGLLITKRQYYPRDKK
ncbi:hypothetical protein [Nostoc sp.]|uniref:hypothetical protein n=1 Tax=Nostoc sp. TaxID=1180 RepID=UPI002FFA3A89